MLRFCNFDSGLIEGFEYGNAQIRACATAFDKVVNPSLWRKALDLRLQRGFNAPVRALDSDDARLGIGDTASLDDALDLRTLV
jgi:hypothetical protein